jgi:hypothetical protein
MSQAKVLNRSALFSAATVLAGFVVVPPPAQAVPRIPVPLAPTCNKYSWPGGGNFFVDAANGTRTAVATSQDRVVGRPFTTPADAPGPSQASYGSPTGGIVNGTQIDFTINWDQGPNAGQSWHYTGDIDDQGMAHGNVAAPSGSAGWSSADKFNCVAEAAPPPPKQCPAGSVKPEVPATENCAPPTDAVRMTIGDGTLTRTVTVTNNGPLGGTCAYDAKATSGLFAPGLNRQINVDPNGSNSIEVPAPPLGSTYHVTLKCTGTYDGKQVQFGQAEQDVSSF